MEIKGKVMQVMPLQSGTSQRTGNAWRKQEYVMETYDRFPRKIFFGFFGDANLFSTDCFAFPKKIFFTVSIKGHMKY